MSRRDGDALLQPAGPARAPGRLPGPTGWGRRDVGGGSRKAGAALGRGTGGLARPSSCVTDAVSAAVASWDDRSSLPAEACYSPLSKIRVLQGEHMGLEMYHMPDATRTRQMQLCVLTRTLHACPHTETRRNTFQGEKRVSQEVSPAASPERQGDSVFILIDSHLSLPST